MRQHLIRLLLCCLLLCGVRVSPARAQQRIALLIAGGTCDARSPFAAFGPNLQAPPNDVRLMADLLVARYGFRTSNISILGLSPGQRERLGHGYRALADRATRKAILTAITELQRSVRPEDYVVVYYSGHGAPLFDADEGIDAGTLVTYEGTKETAIRRKDLESRLDACPSRHLTLILDACFSGLFAKAAPRRPTGLDELRDLPDLTLQNIPKSLLLQQSAGSRSPDRSHGETAPIRDSSHHFTTLAACDEDEQTQEARFSGTDTPLAISEFTWALYHTLWQNQEIDSLEALHVALTRRLSVQRQRQIPQFRRGRQRSELIGPPLWLSPVPSLPLNSTGALSVGRLGGVSRSQRFQEEGAQKGVADPRGAILRVRDLDWFRTDLVPVAGQTRRKYVVPAK
jgi:hypothetical protein